MICLNATVLRVTLNVNGLYYFKFSFLRVAANHPSLHGAFRLCFVAAEGPGREWASCLSLWLVVTAPCFTLMQGPATTHEWVFLPLLQEQKGLRNFRQLWSFVSHSFPYCSRPLPWSRGEWLTGEFPTCLPVAADRHRARMQAFFGMKEKRSYV